MSIIPETVLQTRYTRAKESEKEQPNVYDKKAIEIVSWLDYDFSNAHKDTMMSSGVIARTILLDGMVEEFLDNHPGTIVVNIACGMDIRCYRMEGKFRYGYNIDFSEIIEIRRIIMAKSAKELKTMTLKEFEKEAELFDNDDPSVYNLCRKDYPDIFAELKKEEFTDVLDAGCGTGAVIALFSEKYPEKHYTGIDLSPKMIEVASAKKTNNAVFVCGDCENLPFEDNSFDAITCSMSFHHYPHPVDFFRSCERVLRPGGRLIIRDMTAGPIMLKLINAVEMPLLHLLGKGDVACYGRKDFERFCRESGLKLELFEQRKGFRLHSVMRKELK